MTRGLARVGPGFVRFLPMAPVAALRMRAQGMGIVAEPSDPRRNRTAHRRFTLSAQSHFETLSIYGAAAIRMVPTDGEPQDWVGEGGGLAEAFERVGRSTLVSVLRDPGVKEVSLGDGELLVRVVREASGGRLEVSWGSETVVSEAVAIPAIDALPAGPLFRPAPGSEIDLPQGLRSLHLPLYGVEDVGGDIRWFTDGQHGPGPGAMVLRATVPPLGPEGLGSPAFRRAHRVRAAYVVGAMAGGIASVEVVLAAAAAGYVGFFGAGGLPLPAVEEALKRLSSEAGGSWGANLLHNPSEPAVEEATVDLYLRYGVRRVSASAYMGLSLAVVRYRLAGIELREGRPFCPNHVFAKVSRPEVAERFLRPAPAAMLDKLVASGALTAEQARWAATVPVAEDITAEADSGGHTDHRPLPVLLPELLQLRDRVAKEEGYAARGIHPRVGAAGGLGTPKALWGAFAMGADYVLTGSVNQATREAGTSEAVKAMLGEARFTDVASGPAPDMFELGAKVQVLSRGSMYAQRAQRLYDLYKRYGDLDALPKKERKRLEKQLFHRSLEEVWADTEAYWAERDPAQVAKAHADPRHKMALTFRWYLGFTSRWARVGEEDRKRDYQIWCGPAMGGYNSWAEAHGVAQEERTIASVAAHLLDGAAAEARAVAVRLAGLEG